MPSTQPTTPGILIGRILLLLVLASASSAIYAQTSCGGPGQRACCNGFFEFSNNGLACNSGLVQIPSCNSNVPNADGSSCNCPGGGGVIKSSGTCVRPKSCGGVGQRACCFGLEQANGGIACDAGLTQVDGCAGDCTCGGGAALGQLSSSSCTRIERIAEPATNSTPAANESSPVWSLPNSPLPAGPECPATGLCGYADLHVHMFSNLGHGGGTLAGAPFDPVNGINGALGQDYGSPLAMVTKSGSPRPVVGTSCPPYLLVSPLGNLCAGQTLFHGDHTAIDSTTGGGTNDGSGSNLGVPLFNGWPQWTSTTHQQVYYKWLERAWLGGLRLMVMDAVTNEALCKSSIHVSGADCTLSMTAIDAQIQAAYDFQTWLDSQYGGAGKGWFRIVTSPSQATTAMQQGKLAVVLGIEVENLFNCHLGADTSAGPKNGEGPTCDGAYVQAQVQKYYDKGVRHIFPVHNFDNAFGNAAAWQDAINAGNRAAEGAWYNVQATLNCQNEGYGFRLSGVADSLLLLLGFGISDGYPVSSYPLTGASCNNGFGVTNVGGDLLNDLISKGMVIDVDHMSINGYNFILDNLATPGIAYPAVVATHVQFFDLYRQYYTGDGSGRHERMRTTDQLAKIKNIGGMIAVMLKDDVQDTGSNGWCVAGGNCPFGSTNAVGGFFTQKYNGPSNNYNLTNTNNRDCAYSTTEWAQMYLFGADTMGAPVAMGSDFNGIAGHVGPRFGSGACGGDSLARTTQERVANQLQYPFTIPGFGTFDRQVTGQRSFDFNTDGLAHIGLLPDMVADLKNVGVTDAQLQPLFGSAQAYITMWAKVFKEAPVITTTNHTTFNIGVNGSFTVAATGSPAPSFNYTGTLPAGVSLDPNGSLHGIPALGTGGTYPITITATNSVAPDAAQSFTLTVSPSAFTNPDHATFTVGTAQDTLFNTNFPGLVTMTISGSLPSPLFFEAGQQTSRIGGLPASGTGGVYHVTITATLNTAPFPSISQAFTLTINQTPTLTSPSVLTMTVGQPATFTPVITAYPPVTNSRLIASFPPGLTFTNGVFTGTVAAGLGGAYPFSFLATNPAGDFLLSGTINVNEPPIVRQNDTYIFTLGYQGAYTFVNAGFPLPTVQVKGALPTGLFLDGLQSGWQYTGVGSTPGTFPVTVTISNPLGTVTRNMTLILATPAAPVFTSTNVAEFVAGVPGTFQVVATGSPQPAVFLDGSSAPLPAGLSLAPLGLLSGTPQSAGTTKVLLNANSQAGLAQQTLTINVRQGAPPTQWLAPAAINFGSALGSSQLNAVSSVAGHFVYTPPAGTVLSPGANQILSATFIPDDSTTWGPKTITTTITVNPIPATAPAVSMLITASGSLSPSAPSSRITISLANAGKSAATNVTLTSVKIGTTFQAPNLPLALGTINSGGVATPGFETPIHGNATLSITGTYDGGTFSSSIRLVLP